MSAASGRRISTSSTRFTRQKWNASRKCKARQPYEFGVKVSLAITEKQGLIVGARSFAGIPYDGHTLAGQLEQTIILLQDLPDVSKPRTVLANLGYRGVDADVAPVQLDSQR
ncbi:hypothetical protein [Burkholderia sp.]